MAVPSSGSLTFPDDLVAEFGSPPGTPKLSDYLRGAGLVPDISANSAVPTSFPATFPDDWYGASDLVVSAGPGGTISDTNPGGGSAQAQLQFQSDGDIWALRGIGPNNDIGDWVSPKSEAPGTYEVRCTVNSGSLDSGPTGSFVALTSTRTWTVTVGFGESQSANITIDIRDNGGPIIDSADYTLSASTL